MSIVLEFLVDIVLDALMPTRRRRRRGRDADGGDARRRRRRAR